MQRLRAKMSHMCTSASPRHYPDHTSYPQRTHASPEPRRRRLDLLATSSTILEKKPQRALNGVQDPSEKKACSDIVGDEVGEEVGDDEAGDTQASLKTATPFPSPPHANSCPPHPSRHGPVTQHVLHLKCDATLKFVSSSKHASLGTANTV